MRIVCHLVEIEEGVPCLLQAGYRRFYTGSGHFLAGAITFFSAATYNHVLTVNKVASNENPRARPWQSVGDRR